MNAMAEWTAAEVASWIRQSTQLASYADHELQGINGARLTVVTDTDERLVNLGICEPGDRTALRRMVNEVIEKDAMDSMRKLDVEERSKRDPAWAKRRLVGLSPPAKPVVVGAQLITLTSDGAFRLTTFSSDMAPAARRLAEQVYLLHKAASTAHYNHGNSLALAAAAAQLLTACLANTDVLQSARCVTECEELLHEATEFVSIFSMRGWLTRLTVVDTDLDEFQRLDRELRSFAIRTIGDASLNVQECQDDTAKLRQAVQDAGGLEKLQDQKTLRSALVFIDPVLSEAASCVSEELVTEELADWEAEHEPGGHWAIRNHHIRSFWWTAFAGKDETTWDRFWAQFPKHLRDNPLRGALQAIVQSKVNRDVLQARANRGSPQIATPVELDFVYPPTCDIKAVTQFAVQADSLWLELQRTGATLEGSVVVQAALPELPQLYVPDVDTLDHTCGKVQDSKQGIRLLEVVGTPGRGKLTAAIAVVRHAVMTLHWATGYCAPFQGVTSMPECKFQLMAAFGIPAETQDMSPLYAWLRRNAAMPFGLIMHNVDGMLQPDGLKQQFREILAQILKAAPHSQLIVTAKTPTELLDHPTLTWHMSECSAEQSAALVGKYEITAEERALMSCLEPCPLAIRILGSAFLRKAVTMADVQSLCSTSSDQAIRTESMLRLVLASMEEDLLMALLYLSVFPLSFNVAAAAEVMAMPHRRTRAAALLSHLHSRGVLEYHAPHERYWLHPVVKAAVEAIAVAAKFSCQTARLAFVEHYAAHLQMVSAVHCAGAHKSAMKLFGDEHLNIYELVKWACSSPPPASATLYSDLLWTSVDVLSIRLDDDEKRTFCEACLQTARETKDHLMEGRALWQLGRLLVHRGHYKDGIKLKREGMKLMEVVLGADHMDIANCCTGLARTCCALNAYSEAEDYYGRAYGIQSDALGEEHTTVLDTMAEHAGVLITLSRFAHAEQVYRTVLEMREKQLGPDDPQVAAALTNMGQLLQRQGRYEHAEPLMRRAVKIQEQCHGKTHLQVATALSNLAALLDDSQNITEAETIYHRSLSIREDALGEENVEVAAGFRELAELLRKQSTFEMAESYARQSCSIFQRLQGETSADALQSQCLLVCILRDAGRYFDAVTLGIALLDTTSNCFRDAPSHADALEVLSTVYIQRGLSDDFDAAECHAKEGLAIRVAAHGAKSLEAASMYTVLALAQLRLGRLSDAEGACIKALDIREGVCVTDDLRIAESLCVLCAVHTAKAALERAEEAAERCMFIRQQRCRPSSLQIAEAHLLQSRLFLKQQRLDAAACEAEACIDLRRQALTMQHPAVAEALVGCAEVLCAAGKRSLAKVQAKKAETLYKQILGADHPYTIAAAALASCCSEAPIPEHTI